MEQQNSVEELIQKLDIVLDEYEKNTGIPQTNANLEKLESLLNSDYTVFRKMSDEECGENALILSIFSFHIQKCYNRENTRIEWAESMIKRAIASTISQYKAWSFEEKRMLAIKENDYARKLEEVKIKANNRAQRLAYLSGRIDSIKHCFLELQQTKRKQK